MQGDNANIKDALGITLLIDYLVIYLIYHCIAVFCLYNKMALYSNTESMADQTVNTHEVVAVSAVASHVQNMSAYSRAWVASLFQQGLQFVTTLLYIVQYLVCRPTFKLFTAKFCQYHLLILTCCVYNFQII